jgi:hypothetical protein
MYLFGSCHGAQGEVEVEVGGQWAMTSRLLPEQQRHYRAKPKTDVAGTQSPPATRKTLPRLRRAAATLEGNEEEIPPKSQAQHTTSSN